MSTQSTPKKRLKFRQWKQPFLDALRETGVISYAAERAGIDRSTAYKAKERSQRFAEEWQEAEAEATDKLEGEARRRAVEGVQRLKFAYGSPITVPLLDEEGKPARDEKGEIIMVPYVEHEYSDTLLIFLLKGNRPEKYKDQVDVTSGGKAISIIEPIRPPEKGSGA